jgi:SNF2 family DNA or RNA helicase
MKLKAYFRMALTGTPIQNHLGEIWNLFNFINPGLLGSLNHFTERYIKNDDGSTRKQLKRLISPFLLRRTKAAVLDELPPKTEILLKIPFSTEERAFYEALRRKAIAKMEESEDSTGTRHLQALAEITRLRQACCNAALVDSSLQLTSSKLTAFLELVGELKENNHRALVFSQFVGHLSLIRQALDQQKVSYLYLDGSTPMKERADLVSRFQQGNDDLFLISLKAGGLGLNLTAADYIIHLDPWWNPAIEDQASDRAHRIGQNRPVTVYRLVAEDTIEEKILKLHATKRDLADTLLEGSDQAAKLSLKELMDILKDN